MSRDIIGTRPLLRFSAALIALSIFAAAAVRASAHVLAAAVSPRSADDVPAKNDAYAKAVLAAHPVAYYRVDDVSGAPMCDASGFGNNGTYASSGVSYDVPGALLSSNDGAVGASGAPGVIGQSNSPAPLSGNVSFTYEAWFSSTGSSQNQALVDFGGSGNGNIAGLTSWSHVGGGSASAIGLDEFESSNQWDTTAAGVNLFDGAWHYLVVSYDPKTRKATGYVDAHDLGAQSLATSNGGFNLAASPIRIGNWIDTVINKPLIGDEDEVAVYASALTSSQVLAHYRVAGYAPRITNLSPDAGPSQGGDPVAITGTGFTPGATVKFGAAPAQSVSFVSPTELTTAASAGLPGTVRVAVTNFVGTSGATSSDLYAYGPPQVTTLSPATGPASGGSAVTIIGSAFVPGATVTFGTTASPKVKFVSPTRLVASSPAGSIGSVNVTVTTAAGQSAPSPAATFTYK